MALIEMLVGIVFTIAPILFAYMSSHLVSETKAGKNIPLPWEKVDE